jgi:hypothetical protein
VNRHACKLAHELLVRGLVTVLESPPTADVVNKNRSVRDSPAEDIFHELKKSRSVPDDDARSRGIGVSSYDPETVGLRISLYPSALVFERVLLVFS